MTDRAALLARIEALERESRRAFDDAQREADALFAQYQLSQLVASGGSLAELGRSVALEAVRLAAVEGGALWLSTSGWAGPAPAWPPSAATRRPRSPLSSAASTTAGSGRQACVAGAPSSSRTSRRSSSCASGPSDGRAPDPDGIRVIQLARHELAVAFQGARLREALERERQELTAVVSGTTDLILQVDADRRVVRLNPAGERLLGLTAADALGRTCAARSSAATSPAGTMPRPVRSPR